jgi:hypothetical protein
MPVSLAPKAPSPLRTRRAAAVGAIAIVLALAAAVSIATFSRGDFVNAVASAAAAGLKNIKTVAAMLADRSPGKRPEGALASLKHKRIALHERALPKIRPASPFAVLVGTPPTPPMELPPVLPAPLIALATGGPSAVVTPGGPPIFSDIPPPGGGGGIVGPPSTTPETPPVVPPVTPAVPEPDSWAMMLVGFALVGWTIKRGKRAANRPAAA